MPGPPVAEAVRHRIGIQWRNECRDLFQVQFQGVSIFVHFPYQPDAPGLLKRVEMPPGDSHTFNTTDTADGTTRRIKYSHPIDGRAHFSQDGQIVTTVRNQSDPLDRSAGHFFSVDIAGIPLFRRCGNKVPKGTSAAVFSYEGGNPPDPLHCAGYWIKLNADNVAGITNSVTADMTDGSRQMGMVIAPPRNSPLHPGFLIIFPRPAPEGLAVEPGEFRLFFTGGFATNLHDVNSSSSFLAMQYPAGDILELRLVDYPKDSLPSSGSRPSVTTGADHNGIRFRKTKADWGSDARPGERR